MPESVCSLLNGVVGALSARSSASRGASSPSGTSMSVQSEETELFYASIR